jgi:aminoglycoside phosphotransferase (APT) family kinase protein
VDAVVHNDVKWDNCLVLPNKRLSGEPVLKIVDWEFANLGDSCWDVGAVLSAFLSSWVLSVPVSGQEPAGHFLEFAKYPLARMHPAIRAFWEGYIEGRGFCRVESGDFLLRALRFCAARLLQAAFEQMQNSTVLASNVVCLIQLSFNLLQRPREALIQLVGLSINCEATKLRHE